MISQQNFYYIITGGRVRLSHVFPRLPPPLVFAHSSSCIYASTHIHRPCFFSVIHLNPPLPPQEAISSLKAVFFLYDNDASRDEDRRQSFSYFPVLFIFCTSASSATEISSQISTVWQRAVKYELKRTIQQNKRTLIFFSSWRGSTTDQLRSSFSPPCQSGEMVPPLREPRSQWN